MREVVHGTAWFDEPTKARVLELAHFQSSAAQVRHWYRV